MAAVRQELDQEYEAAIAAPAPASARSTPPIYPAVLGLDHGDKRGHAPTLPRRPRSHAERVGQSETAAHASDGFFEIMSQYQAMR
jgi:hypothetical protein